MSHFPGYLTATDLKARNWTQTAIDKFLGKPDQRGPNPWGGYPTKLYSIARVLMAENSPEMGEYLRSVSKRRATLHNRKHYRTATM